MSLTLRHTIRIAVWLILIMLIGSRAAQRLVPLDSCIYTGWGRLVDGWKPDEYAQLRLPSAPVEHEKLILHRTTRTCPPIHYIAWNAELPSVEGSLPYPKMQEMATILHCLHTKLGVRSAAISSPLMWEDEQGEMARHMLKRALGALRCAAIGLAGRSAPQAQATPQLLQPARIPLAQVKGDLGRLPSANTPQPFTLPDEASLLIAPDYLEDETLLHRANETRGLSMPLLLRWNGEVYASLPLRLALAELGLTPADVHANLGKSIRIGKRILPLDDYGRTLLGAARAIPLSPEDVLTAYMPLPADAQQCAVVCRSFSPQPVDERAERMAATLSQLLATEREMLIPTTRVAGNHLMEQAWIESSLLGRLTTAALLLTALLLISWLQRFWRHVLLLGLLVYLLLLTHLCATSGAWLSVSTALLCWALLWPAQLHLAPREQDRDSTLW